MRELVRARTQDQRDDRQMEYMRQQAVLQLTQWDETHAATETKTESESTDQ